MPLIAIDHVQLAMPRGREADARAFYCDVLGLKEIAKPAPLRDRGGAWFESGDVKIHLGVEEEFRPARKAHPAFVVSDLTGFISRITAAGYETRRDVAIDGIDRIHVFDPFGNRLELMERQDRSSE